MSDPSTVLAGKEVGKIVNETVDSITGYLETKEREKTERARIRACLKAVTEKYKNDRIKFEKYMEKSFEEREKLYDRFEKLLDHAINENNSEIAQMATQAIITVYNKNPMQGFKEANQDNSFLDSLDKIGGNMTLIE